MLPFHERLAELYTHSLKRELNEYEENEMLYCLQLNAAYCREEARLRNEAWLAARTGDDAWQRDIDARLDKLRLTGKPR